MHENIRPQTNPLSKQSKKSLTALHTEHTLQTIHNIQIIKNKKKSTTITHNYQNLFLF